MNWLGVSPNRKNWRCIDVLRDAHLEHTHTDGRLLTIYRRRSYDQTSAIDSRASQQRGTVSAAVQILMHAPETVEVNEPAMIGVAHRTATLAAAARAAGLIHRRPVRIVFYAIENMDMGEALMARFPRFGGIARVAYRIWLRVMFSVCSRVVFGTAGAADHYGQYVRESKVNAAVVLIPHLPSACECLVLGVENAHSAIFVGSFDERKGVRQLIDAWSKVPDTVASSLLLVGTGPMQDVVIRAADGQRIISVQSPPRSEIHRLLRGSKVLVLLSQKTPFWREQVGLPITEAVAHGCRVVTTSETGLADWLSNQGHTVKDAGTSAADWADAIADALASPWDVVEHLAELPSVHGRLAAERWLHGVAAA